VLPHGRGHRNRHPGSAQGGLQVLDASEHTDVHRQRGGRTVQTTFACGAGKRGFTAKTRRAPRRKKEIERVARTGLGRRAPTFFPAPFAFSSWCPSFFVVISFLALDRRPERGTIAAGSSPVSGSGAMGVERETRRRPGPGVKG